MKVLGLITEYNPFHNGHKYHLEKSKELVGADFTVCVMSGNFIQRGVPALLNKWARAKMALLNGIDLVIELPVCYVLQSAELFAYGSVKILDSMNMVDYICFGSECGEIEPLKEVAYILANEPEEVSLNIKSLMNNGYNYAQAREKSVLKYMEKTYSSDQISKIMSSPNNILGIEYLKALYKLNSNIKAATIKRYKAEYHSLDLHDEVISATAIRHILQKSSDIKILKKYMPGKSFNILCNEMESGKAPVFSEKYDTAIISLLRKMTPEQIKSFPDVNEGLENRIFKATYQYGSMNEILQYIKTKRYTLTRLQRIMLNILLGITEETFSQFQKNGGPQYIRVLGMNSKGKELLKQCKKKSSLPIITKPSSYKKFDNPLLKKMIELDFLASDLYSLGYPDPKMRKGNLDLTTSPVIIED